MFHTRERMLGFPSAIFWWLAGGWIYTLSTAAWDIYFLIAFSMIFIGVFAAYAAFALKKKDLEEPDVAEDDGKFVDEEKGGEIEEPEYIYESHRKRKENKKNNEIVIRNK
jgi:hypothetical protein